MPTLVPLCRPVQAKDSTIKLQASKTKEEPANSGEHKPLTCFDICHRCFLRICTCVVNFGGRWKRGSPDVCMGGGKGSTLWSGSVFFVANIAFSLIK